ncbi:MAG: pre-peptidase C-terminal domain-containing protein [Victivallales bacterium]|nr:pre-peptidase C-terminal domain-containing protein [Victivallales bacterium]
MDGTAECSCTIGGGSLAAGLQDIHVKLDANGTVAEYSEINNEQHVSLLVEDRQLCDLVVGSIGLDKSACSTTEAATVAFTIKNIGFAVAAPTKAYIYDGETYLGSVDVESINAGESSARLEFTIAAGTLAVGSHSIRVVADGGAESDESNMDNNVGMTVLTIGSSDLKVSRIALSKNSVNTGESVIVSFTIMNTGVFAADAFTVGIYDGDTLLGTVGFGVLDARLSVSGEFVIAVGQLAEGSHSLRVVADADNAVAETDETNNSRTTALDVTLLDTTAPIFSNVAISQDAETYLFTVTAAATDDVTPASDLTYKLRVADTEDALAAARDQDNLRFAVADDKVGGTLYYQVAVMDEAGNIAWSEAQSFTVADRTAPVIEEVTVTVNDMVLGLAWSATDNVAVTSYKVFFDGELKSTQTATTFTLAEEVEIGTHSYRIEAYDAAGYMATTGDVDVRFDDTSAPVISSFGIAQQPNSYRLSVTADAEDDVTSAGGLKYRLQYAFAQDAVASAASTAATLSPITISLTASDAGRTLYYRLAAIDEAGNVSEWSDVQSYAILDVTAPCVVSGLAETVDGTGVALDWNDATDNLGVTGYYLRHGTSQNLIETGILVTSSQHSLSSLDAGKYYWQVAAVDAAGNVGEWSSVSSFTIFPADPYEPNDAAATAHDLGHLVGESTVTGGAIASATDEDWFSFTLDARGRANDYIQIAFDNNVGDLDLYLYATNGTTLLRSATSTSSDSERLSLDGLQKGTYKIKVAGKNGSMNTYTLSSRKIAGYDPDVYDTNSPNDTMANATVFDIESTPKNTVSGLNLHDANDIDFYQFTLSNMGLAEDYVSISFQNSVGDLDLYLFDASGNQVGKSAGTANTESLSFAGRAAGTYYVQVKAEHGAVNEYSLNWSFTPNTVEADAYEGAEPIAITETATIENLTISTPGAGATREDVFTITLDATGTPSSKITFSNYRSDWSGLNYTLDNSNGNMVLSGTGSEISLEGLAAGEYTLTVDAPVAGSYGEYSVSVSLPQKEDPKRAILVYVAGDNNGHNRYLYDIITMQQAVLNSNVDVYVLFDRSDNSENAANSSWLNYSQWTETRVCKLTYSTSKNDMQNWISWAECNTGSIGTLERFIEYGMADSKADDYVLILMDHGDGMGGICIDENSNSKRLYSDKVANLLSEYGCFSVVALDACLLGNEVSVIPYEGSCDYVIASEALSYSLGYNFRYTEMLEGITADMSSREVADVIISTSNHQASQLIYLSTGGIVTCGELEHTLAAFDVGESGLSDALNSFGTSSASFSTDDWRKLVTAFKTAKSYNTAYYRFSDFMTILDSIVNPSSTLATAIGNFKNAYNLDFSGI